MNHPPFQEHDDYDDDDHDDYDDVGNPFLSDDGDDDEPGIGCDLGADAQARRQRLVGRASDENKRGTYKRRRKTARDDLVLCFLAVVGVATSTTLAQLLGVGEHAAYKRLMGLREGWLVKRYVPLGRPGVWFISERGFALIERGGVLDRHAVRLLRPRDINTPHLGHQLAISHVIAQLLAGGDPLRIGQHQVSIEQIVSEYRIRSAFTRTFGMSDAPTVYRRWAALRQTLTAEPVSPDTSHTPDAERAVALLTPMRQLTRGDSTVVLRHTPDFALRLPDGRMIAVEIELTPKTLTRYRDEILPCFGPGGIYDSVVWVAADTTAAHRIRTAADELGLWTNKRVRVVPLLRADGQRFIQGTWTL